MRPAAGRVLLLAVILPLLAACDPSGPAAPASADVIVQVKADGDVEMMLLLPADRKRLDPLQMGDQVSKAIFPKALTRRVRLDDQGGAGFPIVRVRIANAYAPGRRPRLDLDVGRAVRALHDVGLTSVQMEVDAPAVPAKGSWTVRPDEQSGGSWYWAALRPAQPAPAGEVTLAPRPLRAFAELALQVLTIGSLVAGLFALRSRLRWPAVSCGVAAVGTTLLTVAYAGRVQGDNLGVAGLLSGTSLQVVTLLPLAALLPVGYHCHRDGADAKQAGGSDLRRVVQAVQQPVADPQPRGCLSMTEDPTTWSALRHSTSPCRERPLGRSVVVGRRGVFTVLRLCWSAELSCWHPDRLAHRLHDRCTPRPPSCVAGRFWPVLAGPHTSS